MGAEEFESGSGGLAGWLALRRTPAYAIELRRLRRGWSRAWRLGLLILVCSTAGVFALYAFGIAWLGDDPKEAAIKGALLVVVGLCLAMLARASLAGLRTFAAERAGDTMDVLRLASLSQRDLVLSRLALACRPNAAFCGVIAGVLLISALMHRSFGCWQYVTVGNMVLALALGFFHFSLTALLLCLGLPLGLRIRSSARALVAAISLAPAVVAAEAGLTLLGAWLLVPDYRAAEGLVPPFLALGAVNLFVARGLLARTVRHFEDWASGEPVERGTRT